MVNFFHTTTEVVPDRRKKSYSSLDETNVKRSSLTEPSTADIVAAHKNETSMSLPEQWSKSKYLAAFSSLSQHNAIDKKASTENEIIVAQKQAVAKGTDARDEKNARDEKKATSPPEQSTTNGVTTDQGKISSTQQCANKTHDTSAKKATSLPDQNVTGKNAIEQKKKEKKEKKQKKTKQKKELSPEKTTNSDAIPVNVRRLPDIIHMCTCITII